MLAISNRYHRLIKIAESVMASDILDAIMMMKLELKTILKGKSKHLQHHPKLKELLTLLSDYCTEYANISTALKTNTVSKRNYVQFMMVHLESIEIVISDLKSIHDFSGNDQLIPFLYNSARVVRRFMIQLIGEYKSNTALSM